LDDDVIEMRTGREIDLDRTCDERVARGGMPFDDRRVGVRADAYERLGKNRARFARPAEPEQL